MATEGNTAVRVHVSPDRLKVWVRLDPRPAATQVTSQQILAALEAARIARTAQVEASVEQLAARVQSGAVPTEDFLVAEGTGAAEARDARFVWAERLRPGAPHEDSPAGRISHYERNTIVSVTAGEPIGTLEPADPGKPGTDVCGQAVAPKQRPQTITLKANVTLDPDGRTARAACDGRVVFADQKLGVEPVLAVPGDVDFGTGNINASSDVTIQGSVKDLFRVKTTKNITIQGHVDAAALLAAGDITIRGGVHGHAKATIKAGGCVEMRLCDTAVVEAGRSVTILKECMNSRVKAGDKVVLHTGTIIGGHIQARNAIEVQTLGSPGAVRTLVAVGIPTALIEQVQRQLNESEEREATCRKIREAMQPLVAGQQLSATQNQRVTELMAHADRLQQDAQQRRQRREELLRQAAPDEQPYVLVGGRVYPGTTVVISGKAAVINLEVKGPLKIIERKIDGVASLVMVDELTGSLQALPTVQSTLDLERQAAAFGEERESARAGTS